MLNSASLNPKFTNLDELNNLIADIFAEILTDDMTTYEKVKACYDYLIENCHYSSAEEHDVIVDYYYYYGSSSREVQAYTILKENFGVCDHYSAAFVAMMNTLGLDCYIQTGQTHLAAGGYTYHVWCVAVIDGTEYVASICGKIIIAVNLALVQ